MTDLLTQSVGIIGGGQLGLMMIQAIRSLNPLIRVIDPDPYCPCSRATHDFTQGSLLDFDTIVAFGRDCDRLTTEFEHINPDALAALESLGTIVHPPSHVIRTIQDKGTQKEFYLKNGFPTAGFRLIQDRNHLIHHPPQHYPAVLKLRKHGYDGKGVMVLRSDTDISQAYDAPCILEDWIDTQLEFSVVVVRDGHGNMVNYQPSELIADPNANLLRTLISPARISTPVATSAVSIARRVAEQLGVVGVLAVEFLLGVDNALLINESAPRPHNSGHHTIEAASASQFELHMRAVMGLPLPPITREPLSVMINLIGKPGFSGRVKYQNLEKWLETPNVHVHLYGKTTTKPFRKMGHVTILPPSLSDGITLAETILNSLEVQSQ